MPFNDGASVSVNVTASSIIIGRAEASAVQIGIAQTPTDVTGLAVTATVPEGRRLRLTWRACYNSTGNPRFLLIEDGISQGLWSQNNGSGDIQTVTDVYEIEPAAGNHTWKLQAYSAASGTIDVRNNEITKALLVVEDVGPAGPI